MGRDEDDCRSPRKSPPTGRPLRRLGREYTLALILLGASAPVLTATAAAQDTTAAPGNPVRSFSGNRNATSRTTAGTRPRRNLRATPWSSRHTGREVYLRTPLTLRLEGTLIRLPANAPLYIVAEQPAWVQVALFKSLTGPKWTLERHKLVARPGAPVAHAPARPPKTEPRPETQPRPSRAPNEGEPGGVIQAGPDGIEQPPELPGLTCLFARPSESASPVLQLSPEAKLEVLEDAATWTRVRVHEGAVTIDGWVPAATPATAARLESLRALAQERQTRSQTAEERSDSMPPASTNDASPEQSEPKRRLNELTKLAFAPYTTIGTPGSACYRPGHEPTFSEENGDPKSEIRQVMRGLLREVRECYSDFLEYRVAEGRVTVEFVIHEYGGTQSATTYLSTMDDARLETCIVDVVTKGEFMGAVTRTSVVRYPFLLQTD